MKTLSSLDEMMFDTAWFVDVELNQSQARTEWKYLVAHFYREAYRRVSIIEKLK